MHVSQNCVENLNFSTLILSKEVPIDEFFPDLKNVTETEENIMMNEGLVVELNFHMLGLYDNS